MSKRTENAKRLRAIMDEFTMNRREVSEFLGWPEVTVDSYLAPRGTALHRKMPNTKRQLMDLLVQTRMRDLQRFKREKTAAAAA